MPDARNAPSAAGWFGKIPALGDFAQRRLPLPFVQAWDGWLSEELVEARRASGAEWPQRWLQAPLWRFVLTPHLLDARYWIGLIAASADRVGRRFPLTLAAAVDPPFVAVSGGLPAWWERLALAALKSRESGCDAESLDRAVLEAGSPVRADATGTGTAIDLAVAATPPGASLWWPRTPGAHGPEPGWSVTGLPRGERFRLLWQPAPP